MMSELIKDLSTLNFADYNPRIMRDHADATLSKTMDKFGDLGGITNNMPYPGINSLADGRLVTGHQRVRKLLEKYGNRVKIHVEQRFEQPDEFGTIALGFVGVEGTNVRWSYREVAWDEGTEKAANVAANNVHGENDDEKLAKLDYELSQLENGAELLGMTGQTEKQIQSALESVGAIEPTPPPETPPDETEKPDKLEFATTRDQRLVIERALEQIKSTRDLQAVEQPSLNGAALFVMAQDYLDSHPDPNEQLRAATAVARPDLLDQVPPPNEDRLDEAPTV